ncbi:MAG: zinc ABC transporter substrate-binding protein [bacterium]|nr:zinc ABC transporter substrate-binding protein [bacterium]
MRIKNVLPVLIIFLMTLSVNAREKLKIVSTTSDLASIAREIGKDRVDIVSFSNGTQDPHFIEPRPSMIMKLKKADLVLLVGMNFDVWLEPLVANARNYKIKTGNSGYLDLSQGIKKLGIPQGKVDGSSGHIHPQGNPHYWLDPENVKVMANAITLKLIELSPVSADYFKANLRDFSSKIDRRIKTWQSTLKPYKNDKIITYHQSWSYFANRFNLDIACEIEPKPGIPPSPGHLQKVLQKINHNKIKAVLMEVFYDPGPAEFLADSTGINVVIVPNSVGGTKQVKDYFGLIDTIVNELAEGMK